MALADLIPEAEILLALEPDELGVLLLKVAATWTAIEITVRF
jgi:hypothetical protein